MNKRRIIPVRQTGPMLMYRRAVGVSPLMRAERCFESLFMLDGQTLQDAAAERKPLGEDVSATKVVASIRRAAELLERLLTVDFSSFGLNNARYAALHLIGQSSSAGCSQTELAAGLGQSESSVSGLVSRMRADGLLYRLRTKHDQRKRLLMLSGRGRALLADCELSYRRQLENVLRRFDSNTLGALGGLMDVFVDGLTRIQGFDEVGKKDKGVGRQNRADDRIRRSA